MIYPDRLWIGNAADIRDPRILCDAQIEAVIDLAFEEVPAQPLRQMLYCRFPLNDGNGNQPFLIRQAIRTVRELLELPLRTVVGCSAGLSRSPTIAACALAEHLQEPADIVLARIGRIKATQVNPFLWSAALSC